MVSGDDSGVVGDGGDRGAGVAVGDEEPAGGLENPAPGLLGLIGTQGRVVGAPRGVLTSSAIPLQYHLIH